MVIKALLEGCIKGVGKYHKTSIFPCGIFQLMKGVNRQPEDPNYDMFQLALQSTAKRIYPNYANCDWSGNSGEDDVMQEKEQILASLTAKQREILADRIAADPTIGEKLGLEVHD